MGYSIKNIRTDKIFVKAALIGKELEYKENVLIQIDKGIIKKFEYDSKPTYLDKDCSFKDHILLPGFVNSHTHIGDYLGLDKAWNLTLDEAVGQNGIKYQYMKKSDSNNALVDGIDLLERLGVFAFVDFREEGLSGAKRLESIIKERRTIECKIMARSESDNEKAIKNDIKILVKNGFEIGLNRAIDYSDQSLKDIRNISDNQNKFLGIHLGEDKTLDKESIKKYGQSEFKRVINILKPNFIVHATNLDKDQWLQIPKSILPVLCPRSNFYFNTGISPIKFCLDNDIRFALGTDNFMAIKPSPIEELQYAFISNKLENRYDVFLNLLKTITIIPSLFFKLDLGILEIGKTFKANLFNTSYPEFKYGSWWSNLIFRSNISQFEPIIVS